MSKRGPKKGYEQSKEHRENISKGRTGMQFSEEHRRNISESKKGKSISEVTRVKLRVAHTGKHHSRATIAKIRAAHIGKHHSEETIRKIRDVKVGKRYTKEHRRNISKSKKKLWKNPDFVAKMIKARHVFPNKPEKFLDELLQKLFPNEYKYVGDGEFILAGRCPDFVNINGQKKIIEHFGDYHHGEKKTGIPNEQHAQQRIDLFAKYGYQTLIIWEHELEDIEKVREKLFTFNNGE